MRDSIMLSSAFDSPPQTRHEKNNEQTFQFIYY